MDRLDNLKWLIDRTDRLRTSYAHRATLILTADALMVTVLAILVSGKLGVELGRLIWVLVALVIVALVPVLLSIVYALLACVSLRSGTNIANYSGPERLFLHPKETFRKLTNTDDFRSKLGEVSDEELLDRWAGELWVDLILQTRRYQYLRRAVRVMFFALAITSAAFVAWAVLVATVKAG